MNQTMPKAEFSRLCGVSKTAVAKWIQKGVACIAENDEVHLAVTAERMRSFRRSGLPPAFEALMRGEPGAASAVPHAQSERHPAARRQRGTEHRRADLVARLRVLDWSVPFSEGDDIRQRLLRAAEVAGFQVAESDFEDDGHWGGYQLRSLALLDRFGCLERDAVVAGFGFELDAFEALQECREAILPPDLGPGDDDDLFVIDLELLPALAYPFGPTHRPLVN